MAGISDLGKLLASMAPELHALPYSFAVCEALPAMTHFATVAEDEGLTVVAPLADLRAFGLDAEPIARICAKIARRDEIILTAAREKLFCFALKSAPNGWKYNLEVLYV